MKRRAQIALAAATALGFGASYAGAAFVATTGTPDNLFITRAVASLPEFGTARISPNADCSAGTPGDTVRQGGTFYACVTSVTDQAGVNQVQADLSAVAAGPGNTTVPLTTSGGPWSGHAYRSGPLTARTPLVTGETTTWSVTARNNNNDSATLAGRTVRVRSYAGALIGEFGAPAMDGVVQHYRFSGSGPAFPNAITSAIADATATGGVQTGVPGALVGSGDPAIHLDGVDDRLSSARRSGQNYSHTTSAWIRGTATSGSGPGTAWSDSAGIVVTDANADASEYGIALDATGRVVAGCGTSAGVRSAPGVLTDGNWHHVVLARNFDTLSVALYVDGVPVASGACGGQLHNAATVNYGYSQRSGLSFAGDLDEVTLFTRALSAAEVADLHRLGTGTG